MYKLESAVDEIDDAKVSKTDQYEDIIKEARKIADAALSAAEESKRDRNCRYLYKMILQIVADIVFLGFIIGEASFTGVLVHPTT